MPLEKPTTKTTPKRTIILILLLSVGLNATGQVMFKAARLAQPDATIIELFYHLETWIGLALFGLSTISWLWVLSRAQLSFVYPILSLAFPLVVSLSAILFDETITPMRWLGVGFIIIGVSLMSRTPHD